MKNVNISNVIWSAVISAGSGVASIVLAYSGYSSLSLSLGLFSVSSAILSSREN